MAIFKIVPGALLAASVAAFPANLSPRTAPTLTSQGCFTEPPTHEGRALKGPFDRNDDMTPAACLAFCADYHYAGVEYGRECFCGNDIAPNTNPADGDCTMPCSGDSSLTCGAGDRIEIYVNEDYVAPSVKVVEGFAYKGCRAEPYEARALPDKRFQQDDMTPETCTSLCSGAGYLYAGVQWSIECWCSSTIKGGHWVDDSECDMLCGGDKTAICGGHKLNTIYGPESVTAAAVPKWHTSGCYEDNLSARTLGARQTTASDMTAAKCASFCSDFQFFGVENGNECYFGRSIEGSLANNEEECALPCRGDGTTLCGDADRLNIYEADSMPSSPLTVGEFSYLQCGADSVGARALQGGYAHGDDITVESCAATCADFTYFGVEFGRECFCGNEYSGAELDAQECYKRCSGDDSQICGGADTMSVYTKVQGLPTEIEVEGDGSTE